MASVSAGDVVAEKYRVERLLGRGGMGYVVAARHLGLDQLVAIKFLRKSALSDAEALARFRREAKACVRLKNEHVAKVFDVGVHGDEPFIVMEHLEGDDLGALTKNGRALAVAEACDHVIHACEALAEAHALGIVHRDIKLPNLFLTRSASGQPLLKVLDFGVSKTKTSELESLDVTQTAAVLGSPKYMSPEQMNDPRSVDGRTDIWSLGVCLYRLVSGRPPFDGDTIGRLCTMVLHETPLPLSALQMNIPAALEAVITCCMQKDRSFRFSNVAELAAALVPFASEPERAAEMAAHIANVVGVPLPPVGYLPPQPAPMFRTSQSLDGAAAWAHTMVQSRKERRRSELILALVGGAAALAITIVGILFFGRHPTPVVAASPPPPAMTTPVVATITAPPALVSPSAPVATTNTTAAPTTTNPPRRHGRPGTKPAPRSDDEARPSDGPLPIPGDRK